MRFHCHYCDWSEANERPIILHIYNPHRSCSLRPHPQFNYNESDDKSESDSDESGNIYETVWIPYLYDGKL